MTGASAYLAVLALLALLTLVLPNYTRTTLGPIYSASQLVFIGAVTLALYATFLYIQTVRHRDYFTVLGGEEPDGHAPSNRAVGLSAGLLLLALTGLILLAKKFAAVVDVGLSRLQAPRP